MIADTTTNWDKAALALFSSIDIAQTRAWLDDSPRHFELNPFLGRHPTLLRQMLEGAYANYTIDGFRSPFLRKLLLSVEMVNVDRNTYLLVRVGKL